MQKKSIDPISLLWATNGRFKSEINKIRKSVKIDPDNLIGFVEYQIKLGDMGWSQDEKQEFWEAIHELIFKYKLYGWLEELGQFIATGTVPKLEEISEPSMIKSENGLNISFSIRRPINITNLHNWVERNWLKGAKICEKIEASFPPPSFAPRKPLKNFEIVKEIIFLRDKKKLPFAQISEEIVTKFKLDNADDLTNPLSVKKIYYDYKKYPTVLKKRNVRMPKLNYKPLSSELQAQLKKQGKIPA